MGERPLILVVDEIPSVIRMLTLELRTQGFDVEGSQVGEETYRAVERLRPAAILLELVLPGASGLEMLRRLRTEFPDIPVVVVTTQDTEEDRAYALELGAADFLGKPFVPEDLSTRLRHVLGIALPPLGEGAVRSGSIEIDPARMLVRKRGRAVSLATNEWAVLLALVQAGEAGATAAELLEQTFGPEYAGQATMLAFWIRRLREHLEDDPARPVVIAGDTKDRLRFVARPPD